MRISDWSSDVCSSDLAAGGADLARARSIFAQAVEVAVEGQDQRAGFRDLEVVGRDLHPLPLQLRHLRSEERRVGKECVVRVDLGGRRIIKKKKQIRYIIRTQ